MKNFRQHFANIFDIPRDVMLDLPKISLLGDIQLYIENHRGIIEYKENLIRVSTTLGEIVIQGEGMVLRNIGVEEIYIDGRIKEIFLTR